MQSSIRDVWTNGVDLLQKPVSQGAAGHARPCGTRSQRIKMMSGYWHKSGHP